MIGSPTARTAPQPGRITFLRPAIIWAVGGAWALAIAAEASGRGEALHHDALIQGGLPLWQAMLLALLAWQVMIAAMMVPSSLPLIRLFNHAAATQPGPRGVKAAFLGGYALVWTGFGGLAFAGDVGVHQLVHAWPWLEARPGLISGGALLLAGAYQFSPLKDACLNECRHPAAFMLKHYRRGAGKAFAMGGRHGLFCLGCCWALMVLMFAVGITTLMWMAPLAALMLYEKVGASGKRVVRPAGFGLLMVGAITVLLGPA